MFGRKSSENPTPVLVENDGNDAKAALIEHRKQIVEATAKEIEDAIQAKRDENRAALVTPKSKYRIRKVEFQPGSYTTRYERVTNDDYPHWFTEPNRNGFIIEGWKFKDKCGSYRFEVGCYEFGVFADDEVGMYGRRPPYEIYDLTDLSDTGQFRALISEMTTGLQNVLESGTSEIVWDKIEVAGVDTAFPTLESAEAWLRQWTDPASNDCIYYNEKGRRVNGTRRKTKSRKPNI